MNSFATRRPFTFAVMVTLLLEGILLAALLASHLLGVSPVQLDLPVMLVNSLVAIALLSTLGWWGATGFNAPARWQNLRLMVIPVLLLLVPVLLVQPQFPAPGKAVMLVIVTLLIGFQEEAIYRGILLKALLPRGTTQAVLLSAMLFSVIHANSFLVGRDPVFVIAQIIASFLGGIGLAALRLRLNTIWPLVLLHALNDFIQFSATGGLEAQEVALYIPAFKIAISSIMAFYGWYLLRRAPEAASTHGMRLEAPAL